MLSGNRFIRNWTRVGTRFNDPAREKRFHENVEELDRLTKNQSSKTWTNARKYITNKNQRRKLQDIHRKVTKDTMYEQAARELIGFKFENHAAWAIEDFGDPLDNVKQVVLSTHRVTEQRIAAMDERKSSRGNQIMIQVYAAALNIEDYHISKGWGASYNFAKKQPLLAANKLYRRSMNQPENLVRQTGHGGYSEQTSQFPITLGREFAGLVLDTPPELQYVYPVGMKVMGYLMPHQTGCLAEVCGLPALQCAPMPANMSYTEVAALPFASHYLMNAINRTRDNRTPFHELNSIYYRNRFMSKSRVENRRHLVIGVGGLGSTLVQLLRALGGTVDVLCSHDAAGIANKIQANNVFFYNDKTASEIMEHIANGGVRYASAFNCSRGALVPFESWIGYLMEPDGRVISFDSPETAIKDAQNPFLTLLTWKYKLKQIEKQIQNEINYHGGGNVGFKFATFKCDSTNINEVSEMAESGKIKPCIDSIFTFDNIEGAFNRLLSGGLRGKIIVNVVGDEAFSGSTGNAYYFNP